MSDNQLIIQHYAKSFNEVFPHVTALDLAEIVNQDYIGGWEEAGHKHAGGRRELKMLYASIVLQQPKKILEIGTYRGNSTRHILLASKVLRKKGYEPEFTTVDVEDHEPGFTTSHFEQFPKFKVSLKGSFALLKKGSYDFIFQDGNHSRNAVEAEVKMFEKMDSLKMVFAHDCFLYPYIQDIYKRSGVFKKVVMFKEPAYKAGFLIATK